MLIVAPVKQVISGDTLVVVGNKGATLRVTLTGLKAPRFPQQPKTAAASTSTGNTVDEVFGVDAREFLRPLVVGKKVAFRIDQKHPANADQCYATVWIGTQEGPLDATLNAQVAKEGWARLKEADFAKQKDGELEKLLTKLCTEAEQAGRGVYQSASLAKRIIWDVADDFELFAEALKKQKTTRAVIEYCRDGSTFRVLLLESKIMLWFSLAGVMSARKPAEKDATGATTTTTTAAPQEDPLAAEAKRFTEVRLLQREVTLEVGGYDTTSRIFYGAVKHPNGIIAEELLKVGLAKLIDWSISFLTQKEDADKFRSLQKDAQEKRLGMWKDYVSKSVASGDLKDYEGVVAEVLSGDTIIIRIGTNPEQLREQPWTCEEKRVSLSSIQAPRLGPRNTEGASDEKYASEAREFLRSKFAGAKVKVHIDYSRQPKAQPGSEGSAPPPVRNFATVTTVNKPNVNLAIEIVRKGLAEVVAHRADDDRSPEYDGLLAAQQEAKQSKSGLFSTQETVKYRRLYLQNDATKAKNFLPHLQREKDVKHRCVVEWCSSGSKLGLDIPDQNCVLSFGLAGIVCPSLAKKAVKDSADEPFAKEALAFTRACCLHVNNVKCRVETMDRVGTFLGSLFVPFKNDSEQSLAILLLERGLAKVQPFSADQTKYRQSLYDAEKRAKNARLGVWRDWSEEQERAELGEVEEQTQEEDEFAPLKFAPCVVTDVVDGETVYVRWKTPKMMEDRQKVEQDMERVLQATTVPPSQVKRGQMVCAAFDDGSGLKYYRGRIEFVNAQQQTARVKFIDYGNEDTVPLNKIRPQSQQTASIPPLASERKLAFVKSRLLNEEYGRDAAMALSELVFASSPDLVGCDTRFGLILALAGTELQEVDEEAIPTINRDLIAQGLAFVRTKDGRQIKQKALQRVFFSMQEAEDNAHRKHLNLWRFGDPRQDED